MQRTLKATLAAALIAGAAGQALAQDRDHGDRGQQAPHAEAPRGGAPGGAPQQHTGPGPGGPGGGGPRGEAAPNFQRHEGASPGAPGQQHFDRGPAPGPGAGAAPGAGRNFERDRGSHEVVPPGAGRGVERDRGAHEVVPPGAERGFDNRRDGHQAGAGFDAHNGRDGHLDNRGGQAFRGDGVRGDGVRGDGRGGEHWQPGRYPPVYWAHERYHLGGYHQPYGFFVRSWAFGDILPRSWFAHDYWIGDFYDYGLPYPPPGYTWVRVGGDALMIDQYTGRIAQVVRGIFW